MKKLNLTEEQRHERKKQWKRNDYWNNHEKRKIQKSLKNPNLTPEQKEARQKIKRDYDQKHKKQCRERKNKCNRIIRDKIITHYSNGTMKCARCGFSDLRALTIDHINGGGCDHLKQIKTPLIRWIKRKNFPVGFQILCMNCQKIKQIENGEIQYKRKRENLANNSPDREG